MKILLATSNPHKLAEIAAVMTDPALQIVTLKDIGLDIAEPIEDQPTFEGNALLKAKYYALAAGLPCFADDSGLEVDALHGSPGVISARYSGTTGDRDVVDPANNQKLLNELGDLPKEKRTARFVCAMAFTYPTPAPAPAPGSSDQTNDKLKGSDPVSISSRLDTQCDDGPAESQSSSAGLKNQSRKNKGKNKGVRNLFEDFSPIVVRGTIEGRILGPGDAGYAIDNPAGIGSNGFGYDPLFFVPELGKTTAQLSPKHKNQISHRGNACRLIWEQLKQWV